MKKKNPENEVSSSLSLSPLSTDSPSPGTAENAMTYGVKHPVHRDPSNVTRNQAK